MSEEDRLLASVPPIRGAMTPEKAIEILSDAAFGVTLKLDEDFKDALKLAIVDIRLQIASLPKRGIR